MKISHAIILGSLTANLMCAVSFAGMAVAIENKSLTYRYVASNQDEMATPQTAVLAMTRQAAEETAKVASAPVPARKPPVPTKG